MLYDDSFGLVFCLWVQLEAMGRLAGNERAPWFIPDAPQPPSGRLSPRASVSSPPRWAKTCSRSPLWCGLPNKSQCELDSQAQLPPESLSFTALAEGEGCQGIRFHSAHTDCLTLCLFLAVATPWVDGVSVDGFPSQHFPFKSRGADWNVYCFHKTIPQYVKIV